MSEDEMRAALIEAMESSARGNTYAQWADTILPTVRHLIAEELREAAADVDDGEFSTRESAAARAAILARADALDGAS